MVANHLNPYANSPATLMVVNYPTRGLITISYQHVHQPSPTHQVPHSSGHPCPAWLHLPNLSLTTFLALITSPIVYLILYSISSRLSHPFTNTHLTALPFSRLPNHLHLFSNDKHTRTRSWSPILSTPITSASSLVINLSRPDHPSAIPWSQSPTPTLQQARFFDSR